MRGNAGEVAAESTRNCEQGGTVGRQPGTVFAAIDFDERAKLHAFACGVSGKPHGESDIVEAREQARTSAEQCSGTDEFSRPKANNVKDVAITVTKKIFRFEQRGHRDGRRWIGSREPRDIDALRRFQVGTELHAARRNGGAKRAR